MTDCELFGHPLVDGFECPCGHARHKKRTAPADPMPYPQIPMVLLHLSRPCRRTKEEIREAFRPAAPVPVEADERPETYRERRARSLAAGRPATFQW